MVKGKNDGFGGKREEQNCDWDLRRGGGGRRFFMESFIRERRKKIIQPLD
jgi:hypothetical protein